MIRGFLDWLSPQKVSQNEHRSNQIPKPPIQPEIPDLPSTSNKVKKRAITPQVSPQKKKQRQKKILEKRFCCYFEGCSKHMQTKDAVRVHYITKHVACGAEAWNPKLVTVKDLNKSEFMKTKENTLGNFVLSELILKRKELKRRIPRSLQWRILKILPL